MIVFLNGSFVPEEQATVSVFDRGFVYGDGLFETIWVQDRRPFRWSQHLERLERGADFLGIRVPYSPKDLRRHAATLLEQNQMNDALLRVNLTRGVGPRGYSLKGADSPFLVMTLHPATQIDPANPPRWQLATSSHRLPTTDPLSSFKTSHKLLQILARAEAEAAGADEALLLNTNGEIAETASANIFWVYRETIYATPSGRGALPGVTRAVVLEICQALGLPTHKKVIKPEAFRNADGIFLALSSLGIVPVSSIDGEPVSESPMVDRICRAYWDAVAKG